MSSFDDEGASAQGLNTNGAGARSAHWALMQCRCGVGLEGVCICCRRFVRHAKVVEQRRADWKMRDLHGGLRLV